MSFSSETFRLLIASPSDLQEERQAAADAVNEWNAPDLLPFGPAAAVESWLFIPAPVPRW